jgi:hypothetical protein
LVSSRCGRFTRRFHNRSGNTSHICASTGAPCSRNLQSTITRLTDTPITVPCLPTSAPLTSRTKTTFCPTSVTSSSILWLARPSKSKSASVRLARIPRSSRLQSRFLISQYPPLLGRSASSTIAHIARRSFDLDAFDRCSLHSKSTALYLHIARAILELPYLPLEDVSFFSQRDEDEPLYFPLSGMRWKT